MNKLSRSNKQSVRSQSRQRRQSRSQRGGNNVEVLIYCNLKEKNNDTILARPITQSEKWDVDTYVDEFVNISKNPKNSSVDIANLLNSLINYSIEILSTPYKNYHFALKLTLPKTETHKLVNKVFLKDFWDGLAAEYIRFEYGTDYSGNLLSNDKNEYYLSYDDYEIVGAGNSDPVPISLPTLQTAEKVAVASKASTSTSVSKKAPTPAQLRKASAKASGVKYVPVKSANIPLGCFQKDYVITTKRGTTYSTKRCLDSKDPKINDVSNCMINPETNKCKRVVRK